MSHHETTTTAQGILTRSEHYALAQCGHELQLNCFFSVVFDLEKKSLGQNKSRLYFSLPSYVSTFGILSVRCPPVRPLQLHHRYLLLGPQVTGSWIPGLPRKVHEDEPGAKNCSKLEGLPELPSLPRNKLLGPKSQAQMKLLMDLLVLRRLPRSPIRKNVQHRGRIFLFYPAIPGSILIAVEHKKGSSTFLIEVLKKVILR